MATVWKAGVVYPDVKNKPVSILGSFGWFILCAVSGVSIMDYIQDQHCDGRIPKITSMHR